MKLMTSILLIIGTTAMLAPAAHAEEKKLLQYERRLGLFGMEYRAGFGVELDRGVRLHGQAGAGPRQYNWRLHLGPGGVRLDTGRPNAPDRQPRGPEEV
jgi:hypothetical protein